MSNEHLSLGDQWRIFREEGMPSFQNRNKAVAVFPSIWPDPYGMVVDECLAVGIPVIAFDL
jgi:glycosyltransferase involved in cell wall biosynthesis